VGRRETTILATEDHVSLNFVIDLGITLLVVGTPLYGWSHIKVLITVVLLSTGELMLLLTSGSTALVIAMTSLSAGLLMLAEMTRGFRDVIGGAWYLGGFLLMLLNWKKDMIGHWAREWRPWLMLAGLVVAGILGLVGRRAAGLARGRYGDVEGI
jgi:hypothetical protein